MSRGLDIESAGLVWLQSGEASDSLPISER